MDRTQVLLERNSRMNPMSGSRFIEEQGADVCPPQFVDSSAAVLESSPHQVEREVQRELMSHPGLHFSSLVVRRLDNGVCLQGVLEVEGEEPDVCSLAQRVAGVQQVLNHLVMAPRHNLPPKG
jgi:hypothetical protein